jgi:thiamine biosynthesis protein ThiI
MARIAEAIAEKEGLGSLTTGESLGQVASQTQESLLVTNEAAHLPVLRPLIGMDKQEIVEIAQRIGTFETSILPYEDCCTIFVPKHPDTKPKLAAVKKSEEALAETAPEMIRKAVEDSEIIRV